MPNPADIYELVLDRPRRNALGSETMRWIIDQMKAGEGRPLLLTGSGDVFSAGLDLREVSVLGAADLGAFLALLDELVDCVYGYPGPVAAAVNGHAVAGGCILAMCCERRIAADHPGLRVGLNELAIGVPFPPKIFELVRRRVPRAAEVEVVLGAGLHGPADALRLGLVDAVAPDPVAAARAWLGAVGGHPRHVYAATKAAMFPPLAVSAADVAAFREHALAVWTSPEVRGRMAARLSR